MRRLPPSFPGGDGIEGHDILLGDPGAPSADGTVPGPGSHVVPAKSRQRAGRTGPQGAFAVLCCIIAGDGRGLGTLLPVETAQEGIAE